MRPHLSIVYLLSYGKILQPTPPDLNKRDFCEAVLRNCGETLSRSEFQLGLSKVFTWILFVDAFCSCLLRYTQAIFNHPLGPP